MVKANSPASGGGKPLGTPQVQEGSGIYVAWALPLDDELELLDDEELLDEDELLLDDEDELEEELEEELLDELLELAALPPHPAVINTQISAGIDNAFDQNLFNRAIVMDLGLCFIGYSYGYVGIPIMGRNPPSRVTISRKCEKPVR